VAPIYRTGQVFNGAPNPTNFMSEWAGRDRSQNYRRFLLGFLNNSPNSKPQISAITPVDYFCQGLLP
jgi:hypothetical protein